MDDVFYEKTLYRILQGRLRLTLGDLVLFVYEPTYDIIEESYEIYDQAYKKAYFRGCYLKKDLTNILVENDLWSPFDDREAEKLEEKIEDLKVQAYESYKDKKQLKNIKAKIRHTENIASDFKIKKHLLDHVSCEGVAAFARSVWTISKTTKFKDGQAYDWITYHISVVLDHYTSERITTETIKKIARKEPWKTIWSVGKNQNLVFNKSSFELTKDQLALSSFATMLDNIAQHPESPPEEVIDDDDCLDGWCIVQKRKQQKDRKLGEIESKMTNSKIKDSQEVFVVAKDRKEADEIYALNNPLARSTIRNRQEKIKAADGDQISFTKFDDVRQQVAIQSHQQAVNTIKGGKR